MNLNELLNAYHYSRFRFLKLEDRNSSAAELWKTNIMDTVRLLDDNFPDWTCCITPNGLTAFTTDYVIIGMELYSAKLLEEVRKQYLLDLENRFLYGEDGKPDSLVDMNDKIWREGVSERLNQYIRKVFVWRYGYAYGKRKPVCLCLRKHGSRAHNAYRTR